MDTAQNWIKDIAPFAAAIAALVVAGFNFFVTRTKTALEIRKLEKELADLSEDQKTTSESLSRVQKYLSEDIPVYRNEEIIYKNTDGNIGYDFRGNTGKLWSSDGKPISAEGRGAHKFLDPDLIQIDRENKEGRYEIHLQNYLSYGQKRQTIQNDASGNTRNLRVACEARSLKGEHALRFILRDPGTNKWFSNSVTHKIRSTDWMRLDGYFSLPPGSNAELRIDDLDVSDPPSSVQIRKIQLTQLKSD
jgi:hypothetical protein